MPSFVTSEERMNHHYLITNTLHHCQKENPFRPSGTRGAKDCIHYYVTFTDEEISTSLRLALSCMIFDDYEIGTRRTHFFRKTCALSRDIKKFLYTNKHVPWFHPSHHE